MAKNLIYQVKVGPNPPQFYDTCINSVKQYCEKYGIDHTIQTEPVLKIRPLHSYRSVEAVERLGYLPIYEKEVAFNYLNDYDKIAIVDSDIFIREQAPNIFDQIDDQAFAGVREKDMPLTQKYINKIKNYSKGQYGPIKDVKWPMDPQCGYIFYNMGLMLITKALIPYLNGQTPEQFLRRPEFEDFINGKDKWRWSTDQTLLNYWVQKSQMPVKNLDWKWNALFKGVKDDKLPQSYFIHFFLSANLPKKGAEIPYLIKNLDQATKLKGHR